MNDAKLSCRRLDYGDKYPIIQSITKFWTFRTDFQKFDSKLGTSVRSDLVTRSFVTIFWSSNLPPYPCMSWTLILYELNLIFDVSNKLSVAHRLIITEKLLHKFFSCFLAAFASKGWFCRFTSIIIYIRAQVTHLIWSRAYGVKFYETSIKYGIFQCYIHLRTVCFSSHACTHIYDEYEFMLLRLGHRAKHMVVSILALQSVPLGAIKYSETYWFYSSFSIISRCFSLQTTAKQLEEDVGWFSFCVRKAFVTFLAPREEDAFRLDSYHCLFCDENCNDANRNHLQCFPDYQL